MAMEYIIVRAKGNDKSRLADFLRRAFYPQEPLSVSMGVQDCPSDVDVDSTLRQLGEGSSLLAVKADGTIIGACVCGSICPSEADLIAREAAHCPCPHFSNVLRLLAAMERGSRYWEVTGAAAALAVYVVAVDASARRQGIARALLDHARVVAEQNGYPLLHVDCTSAYSSRIMEQMGMECVYSLKYEDFKCDNGYPVFQPPPPHMEMKKFILRL